MDYKRSWETTDGVSALRPRPVPASSSDANEEAAAAQQEIATRRTRPDVALPPSQSTARTISGSGPDYAAQTKQNTRLNGGTNKPNRSFRNKKKNSQPAIPRAPPPPPLREDYEMVDLDVTILSAAPNNHRDGSTIMSVVNSSENFHPEEDSSSNSDDDDDGHDAIRDNRNRRREASDNKNNNGCGFSRLCCCCFRSKQ